MNVVVIGGTGHVGTFLIPRLIIAGHEVISISRNQRKPYQVHWAWNNVRQVVIDREAAEKTGDFGKQILELEPDIVIDLICYTQESARQLVESLEGKIQHFLHCGTVWIHGYSLEVPTTEDQPRAPLCEYGKQKVAIEEYLLKKNRMDNFPATILHPGHISGPGWMPINPAGNLNLAVFTKLMQEEQLILPNLGMETVHHVHADDVAHSFVKAIEHRNRSIGENFHVVSPQAITLRGYAEKVASWFNKKASLEFLPWKEWQSTVSVEDTDITYEHISHSPNCSIEKAKQLIHYQPRYSSMDAVFEALMWLIKHKVTNT